MSKTIAAIGEIAAGAAAIAGGLYLEFVTLGASTPLTEFLISAGAGLVLTGIGTMLTGPVAGSSVLSKNPIAPWQIIYGRAKVGGTTVYIAEFGSNNAYLDLVIVLAAHPCAAVDAVMLDGKRLRLDANGCSYYAGQQTIDIVSVVRTNDVVTMTLRGPVTDLQDGDSLIVENVSDHSFNGTWPISTTSSNTVVTYVCGGYANTVTGSGRVVTTWADYGAKVHAEFLLGNHTATFPGMLNGTPYDGDLSQSPVQNPNNPWTSTCLLLGKTSAFLRFHYSDSFFANGIPTISFHVRGVTGIYDPRVPVSSSGSGITVIEYPTTSLNGWGPNAQQGPYELGSAQSTSWGFNSSTTGPYDNAGNAFDGDQTTYASTEIYHTHAYAGCIWSFATITQQAGAPQPQWLNILSAIPTTSNNAPVTLRSAGIWYSLDGGNTYTELYNATTHPFGWDSVQMASTQDLGQVRVMAFTDSHDDMSHRVYEVSIGNGSEAASTGNGTNDPTAGYTDNAALCIADFLANKTWGFGAAYGTEIPTAQLISAANICDEQVALAAGGTESRYCLDGAFNLEQRRGDILQNMLTSCAGRLTFTQGQFVIWPAAWYGSSFLQIPPPPAITSATMEITTSLTQGTIGSYAHVIFGEGTGPFNFPTYWVIDQGNWTNRVDTYLLDPGNPGGPQFQNLVSGAWQVWFMIATNGSGVESTPEVFTMQIGSLKIVVGYSDGSTEIWAPSSSGSYTPPNSADTENQQGNALFHPSALYPNVLVNGPGYQGISIQAIGGYIEYPLIAFSLFQPLAETLPVAAPVSGSTGLEIASGPFRWRQKVSIRDLYNGVKGTYVSPTNNWQASDIPPYAQDEDHGYTNSAYPFGDANLAADGGVRRWLDIQLPFTISCPCAQRLCKIELLRRRQQGTGTFAYNMSLYRTTALDIVMMTLPLFGWVNKLLEVSAHRFTLVKQNVDGNEAMLLGCELDLQETDPSVYEWSTTDELSAQGFQQGGTVNSSQGQGATLVSYATYQNSPAVALVQTSTTTITLAATSVEFPSATVTYNSRVITIPDPGSTPTWYYVCIEDSDYQGDQVGVANLPVSCLTASTNCGVEGYTYMGAVLCSDPVATSTVAALPGGWPAPTTLVVG